MSFTSTEDWVSNERKYVRVNQKGFFSYLQCVTFKILQQCVPFIYDIHRVFLNQIIKNTYINDSLKLILLNQLCILNWYQTYYSLQINY